VDIKSYTPDKFRSDLDEVLFKQSQKSPVMQVLVESPLLGGVYEYPRESMHQPFHGASVGKLFTTTVILQLVQESRISLSDPITKHLPAEVLDGLFVRKGHDHVQEITVNHLITHTSGLADHFGDRAHQDGKFWKIMIQEPQRRWTPLLILDYYRRNMRMFDIPGKRFHYSDTGFILLGLLIESVTGNSLQDNFHSRIFQPLKMNNSHLMFLSQPVEEKPLRRLYFNGIEATEFESLSADWAGGGVASTPHDLNIFIRALFNGVLVDCTLLEKILVFPSKFRNGIHYGTGMMELHMEEFYFRLKGYPRVRGHIGILSTHLWYDRESDTSYVLNYGSNRKMSRSFRTLIRIMGMLRKIDGAADSV